MCKDCRDLFNKTSVGSYIAFDNFVTERQPWQPTDECWIYWTGLDNYGCLERAGTVLTAGHRLVTSYKKTSRIDPTDFPLEVEPVAWNVNKREIQDGSAVARGFMN